ncbi:outer membrane lipoprotein carrier protein LolA [Idiomarina loihiensis]|uniref:outer membrane lipoprotein carrier protein LolA n=2 Tax=Idiomarinaceae TaxID=267893 RepID=UPI000D70F2C7|nr:MULTISPECIES: outer membrane lipoprotein carrier protein LolA [Idiomarina]PWW40406.1 outer membrane lipoprotein carrier protein LolA [Idiomarina loihiensis]TDP50097.1 outer membrane lipoprotein carrier protein LolA [Idiomarina loihiensis]TDS24551.1 outer membrane lipoprotein carrier protein LolA [Idiomarina sp. H2]
MIRLLLATTLLITSAMVVAGEDMTLKALSALEKQSEPLPLSLEFSQKKQLSGLPRPLVSSGQLDISKDEIVWTTEQPQQQQLTINRQGIFEQGNENSVSGSDTIAQLLLAILQQDEAVLKQQFRLSLEQNCVVMVPEADALASVIEKIHSCGIDSVELVELFEQNGNTTRIELSKR